MESVFTLVMALLFVYFVYGLVFREDISFRGSESPEVNTTESDYNKVFNQNIDLLEELVEAQRKHLELSRALWWMYDHIEPITSEVDLKLIRDYYEDMGVYSRGEVGLEEDNNVVLEK